MAGTETRKGQELRAYLLLFKRWLWLLAVCAVIGGVGTFIMTSLQPPIYRATALLVVDQQPVGQDTYSAVLASDQLVATYANLAVQPSVLKRAAANVGGITATDLATRVHAAGESGTQLIELQVDDGSPTRAAALANAIATAFIAVQDQTATTQYAAAEEQLNGEISAANSQIDKLTSQLNALRDADAPSSQINSVQAQLNALTAQRSTLQTVSAQLKTQDIVAGNNVRIFQEALPPSLPDHPKSLLYGATGAAFGLVFAAIVVLLAQFLDDRVRTAEDIEALTGLVSLATLSVHRRSSPLLTPNDSSRLAESFRILRTNLSFTGLDRPIQSIVVTSALPGEGKTTTSVNLAISFALAGKRVLLVDADLRRPSVHKVLQIENGPGLSLGLLEENRDPSRSFAVTTLPSIQNLYVLTAGPKPPNPTDLLASERMQAFLRTVVGTPRRKGLVDIAIFDTPPAVAFAEASVLSAHVDTTLVVVDGSSAHAKQLSRAIESLNRVNARIAGIVLNRVKQRREESYYYAYEASNTATNLPVVPQEAFLRAASRSRRTSGPSSALAVSEMREEEWIED